MIAIKKSIPKNKVKAIKVLIKPQQGVAKSKSLQTFLWQN
jgi:hypothetical protein